MSRGIARDVYDSRMSTATLDAPPRRPRQKPTLRPAPARPVEDRPAWVTADQVAAMTNDYPRVEIWYGELRVKMAARPRKEHGEVQIEVGGLLREHIKPRKLGKLFSESGVLLREEPDVLFGPDVAFYASGRGEGHRTFYRGGPDLVVEIRSPSNTQPQITEKIDIYFRYGTRLVWVVDIVALTVTVHRPDAEPQVLQAGDTLDGGDVLPGFSVRVSELFAA